MKNNNIQITMIIVIHLVSCLNEKFYIDESKITNDKSFKTLLISVSNNLLSETVYDMHIMKTVYIYFLTICNYHNMS